jgi:hypothetical protein
MAFADIEKIEPGVVPLIPDFVRQVNNKARSYLSANFSG